MVCQKRKIVFLKRVDFEENWVGRKIFGHSGKRKIFELNKKNYRGGALVLASWAEGAWA